MATRKKRSLTDGEKLIAKARSAAKKRRLPDEPLSRSVALAEAPWNPTDPPAWERPFREAYADTLAERGGAAGKVAKERQGSSSGSSGSTDLIQCKLYLSKAEQDAQKALAKQAGLSWSTWARRKLAT